MRRYILYGVIIFQIALIISLTRGIQVSRRSAERIASLEETKMKLEQEKIRLQEEAKYIESPYYLETVAREELKLSKPGETVVIIPESLLLNQPSEQKVQEVEEKENWQKWWEVLSGRQ